PSSSPSSHTHSQSEITAGREVLPLAEGVSGRDAKRPAGPEFGTGTEWAGDRELRLGFRLHHRRVVNPFEGRAEATGGDSVRCFSYTEGARPFPAEDRGLLSGVVSQTRPFLLGDGSCPAAAADGSPELSPLPCAIRTAENQGRTRHKARRAILLKWNESTPPTHLQWLRNIMSYLNLKKISCSVLNLKQSFLRYLGIIPKLLFQFIKFNSAQTFMYIFIFSSEVNMFFF
ncbi:uncharacterized protein LOC132388118, partial [Hypanus sabinus]|uniref:uncharacterized protein LOC132388118 n=1 Tax=Hypanus sabinus TaxID=79690 RepID=UPI0028C4E221